MAQGDFPDDSGEAEKARYRRKLAEWKAMGFDVSALEVLLETDFEKFKERRFELMRSQIHGAGPARPPATAPPPESPPGPSAPPQVLGAPRAPAFQRRPGLHSHFTQFQQPRPPATPSGPGEPAPRTEHLHSEMRYPSARRRGPERPVRTYSVAVDHDQRPRGIQVDERPRPSIAAGRPVVKKKVKVAPRPLPPVRPRGRPAPPEDERPSVAIEAAEAPGPDEEPEMAVEEEGGPEGPSPRPGEQEHIAVVEEGAEEGGEEEAALGEAEPEEEGPEEREPGEAEHEEEEPEKEEGPPASLGFFTPASRVPMKRPERPVRRPAGAAGGAGGSPERVKKVRKVAAGQGPAPGRRPPYGWMAVAVVIMLIVAGLAGYMFLMPRTTVTARAAFPATAVAGELVQFDGSNSTTTGKSIFRYEWSFGDGNHSNGKSVSHVYLEPGTYTVSLSVEDQDGTRSAPHRSQITVSPLAFTVPDMKAGDNANYIVNGTADVRNTVDYLYKVQVAGQQVSVSEIELQLNGTMDRRVWGQEPQKDGFGVVHNALNTTSRELLLLFGNATGSPYPAPVPINGELDYNEYGYADAATGEVFQVRSRAFTSLHLSAFTLTTINSTDTLRAYPGVAGMGSQFLPQSIYKGLRLGQSEGPANGTVVAGNTTYYWSRMGVRNVGGRASIGLHVTAEKAYMDRNGFSEFHIDLWVSGSASMPTSTLLHVVGDSGNTHFSTDHLTTMTDFRAGSGAIDYSTQNFDPSPLPDGLFYSPFVDVIAAGADNSTLRFTPEQVVQEASARDGSFRDFLSQNPQSYACAGKYYEGQFGPGSATWNLTFSWPGATSSYWVNVTQDILNQYTVHGSFSGGLSQVRTAEGAFARMLSLSSAEGRMNSDPETARTFFKSGAVDWAGGTSLELESDAMYPSINLASLYASPERAGYAAILSRGSDSAAFSTDTGQMMYFYTHSGS